MKHWMKATAITLAALTLSACGSNGGGGILQNLAIKTFEDPSSHNTMVQLSADLGASSVTFPMANLTFLDPKNSARQIGTLTLGTTVDGHNTLILTADASSLKLGGGIIGDNRLPNGNPIPVAGVNNLIAIQAGGSKTKLYFGEGNNKIVFGVAIAMKEFDGLGATLPGASLFFPFSQGGVNATGGFFAGPQTGMSGVGVFAQTNWPSTGAVHALSARANDIGPEFLTRKPTSTEQWKLNYFFWNLNRRATRLHLAE